ncbi:MAG: histone [Nanoarchaeota archaeon]|nr:NFYB/HAP3 family transcription factor subunit [Nanoarchaeota archaeon]MCK5630186.1 NFYB/HAP3 family transcription factor subunit [Nanoarchaeota archaeon]MEA3513978.1 histone [Nanoarchaeota archaeon]
MAKRVLPLAAMEKLLKNCGADRVSDEAKAALRNVLEEVGEMTGKQAIRLANHAGRKTVKADDIKLARLTIK